MLPDRVDLVVVGAGIVGLAHAYEAHRRGLTVAVIDRDARPVGASVRNFGHCGVTAQAGEARRLALASRERWLTLGSLAGFWVSDAGAVVAARADDEMAVLQELADVRRDEVVLLEVDEVRRRTAVGDDRLCGGAHLRYDVRVDPREAVPRLAAWLAGQPGIDISWTTSLLGIDDAAVYTTRGPVVADRVVVCVGHDVDRVFPDLADTDGVRRCGLHMLRVAAPDARRIDPAVLTGTSLLRYGAFAELPSQGAVRARLEAESPELLAADVNLMLTQHPGGDLLIGDTHHRDVTLDAFQDEALDDLILRETARLLGTDRLTVRERWQGVYASAPKDFLVAAPLDHVRVVSVTTGIGMSTGLGLAPEVLDELLG